MDVEEVFSDGEDSDFELDENVLRELYKADTTGHKATPNSIKNELRAKIQQRRISEGQDELKVVFEPPKTYELTPEEREKVQKRKHRNRQSANQSRINRQKKLERLITDEKQLSAENQRLRADVGALKKMKMRLEAVVQNHEARCNMKDNTSTGYFTNLLKDTNSLTEPTEGSSMVSSSTTNANPPYNNVNGGTIVAKPLNGSVLGSTTNAIQAYDKTVNNRFPSNKETLCQYSEGAQRVTSEQALGLSDMDRMHLRSMSKEQKISLLKAYLKGNQSKPEIQKLMGQISQMTRNDRCVQNI